MDRVRQLRKWPALALVAVAILLGWSSSAGAAPEAPEAPTPACADDEGSWRDAIANFMEDVWIPIARGGGGDPAGDEAQVQEWADWVRGGRTHDGTAPAGTPEWIRSEIVDHNECFLIGRTPQPACPHPGGAQQVAPGPKYMFDRCWGSYAPANYDLGYKGGDDLLDRNTYQTMIYGSLMGFFWNIAKIAVRITLWIIGYAYSFDLNNPPYPGLVSDIGRKYNNRIVGPLILKNIAWFVLAAWAVLMAARGKLGHATSEIAVSIVMVGLATILVADIVKPPPKYMEEVATFMDMASGSVLVAARDQDPSRMTEAQLDTGAAVEPLQRQIHDVFIEQAYDYLNWGQRLTGECAVRRTNIISLGDNVDNEWARRYMARAPNDECKDEAAFNEQASSERMIGSLVYMIVAFALLGLLGVIGGSVVLAKFLFAALFALAVFAAVAAIFPTGGRRIAWHWMSAVAQLLMAVVGLSLILSALLLSVQVVLNTTNGIESLVERWFIVLGLLTTAWFGRRRMMNATRVAAQHMSNQLTRVTSAGAYWVQPIQGAVPGVDTTGMDTIANNVAVGAGVTSLVVGRNVAQRMDERRVARRALRNLEIMERTREGPYRRTEVERGPGGTVRTRTTFTQRRQMSPARPWRFPVMFLTHPLRYSPWARTGWP
jgi:hypothetical protein